MPLEAPNAPDLVTKHRIRLRGGISESWDSSGPKATVVYRCAWEDRYDLARELMGGYPADAAGFAAYQPPHRYPPSPNMWCTSISSIEGLGAKKKGAGSKWLPYKLAEVTAVYGTPTFDVEFPSAAGQIDPGNPILYCRQRVRSSSAFVVLPEGKIVFDSGAVVSTEVGRPEAQSEFTLEFPRVPFNPYLFCKPYLNRTNSVPMFGLDVGCVFFDSIDTDTGASSEGLDNSVVLTFLGREVDWNKLVNDAGDYELVKFQGTSKRPFSQANLLEMFA